MAIHLLSSKSSKLVLLNLHQNFSLCQVFTFIKTWLTMKGTLIALQLPPHPSTLNLFFQAALSSNIHCIVISSLWTGFLWNRALHFNLNSFQISDSKLYLNLCFPLNFNHPLSLLFIHTSSTMQTFNFLQILLFTTLQCSPSLAVTVIYHSGKHSSNRPTAVGYIAPHIYSSSVYTLSQRFSTLTNVQNVLHWLTTARTSAVGL